MFLYGESSSNTKQIEAWKNGSLVWDYSLPCSNGSPAATTIGVDGNFYTVIGGCGSNRLIGLTPTAQSGTTDPDVVLNQSFSGGVWSRGLAAYDNGLVLHKGDKIQYVSYSGTFYDPIELPNPSYSNFVQVERWFEASTAGRVFVVNKADPNSVIGCPNTNETVASITALSPNGTGWTAQMGSGCHYVREIHPTPSGGAIIRDMYQPVAQGTYNPTPRLSAFDSNGDVLWMVEFQATSSALPTNDLSFAVDLNGNVAVRANVVIREQIGGSNYKFPEIRFILLSGGTGNPVPGAHFVLKGDTSTTNGPSYMYHSSEVTIAKDTAYVVASECSYFPGCDPATTKLYAFTVPGLQGAYPRDAILRHDEPWLNYVAMGDSFSSGEGVEPFITGTDTAGPPENRCHRSEQAYPQLLGGNPALRLQQPLFVACSGAETQHITTNDQYDNQPPQVEALGPNVDVVTITIGGNDIGFEPFATACFWESDCTQGQAYQDTLDALEDVLPGALDSTFSDIAAEIGSNTRVLVVGYPTLIPEASTTTTWPDCSYLDSNEKTAARGVITDLNQAVHDAADRAGHQFEYVDVNYLLSPFNGHELCNDGSYFHGVVLPPDVEYSFHPNEAGQDAYRQVITTYLGG